VASLWRCVPCSIAQPPQGKNGPFKTGLWFGHNGPLAPIHKDFHVFITVNHANVYAYTGGKAFAPERPTVVFVHGALNDHSVWILQSRYFAHHGYNVLAIDLPGHCKSGGEAPETVEQAAQTVTGLLDALGVEQAALVGHSLGSLIALEVAAQAPERVSHLALLGTAFPMRVSAALLDAAVSAPLQGIDMVNTFSHSTMAPPPSTLGPGTWLHGTGRALMRRVLASNLTVNVFYRSFKACDSYQGGEHAMAKVQCPTVFVLGDKDQMTPPKAAQTLVARALDATVCHVAAGHALMEEAPEQVLQALRALLARGKPPAFV
jgi:pimeloyl-ACP methyl ester carboxylesterase